MRKIRICCEQVVVEGGDAGHLRATRFGLPADVIMMFSLAKEHGGTRRRYVLPLT
jgi:hypothetical protein